MDAAEPSSDVIEVTLEKLLSSAAFRGRPRLRRFLTHVIQHSLAGRADSPKEYTLGVEVFDRGARFDPRCDSIVRVEASNLRKTLHDTTGRREPRTSSGLMCQGAAIVRRLP